MAESIPVSVIVVTKNAAASLAACLEALQDFDEIIVVDSHSTDQTAAIAAAHQVPVIAFAWNGQYPKKRQWCLTHVSTRHEWIFFVDADEILTHDLRAEIFWNLPSTAHDAFYVRGQPIFCGKLLHHGRWNNKLALARKTHIRFPDLKDADNLAMGEIEGHYQPMVKGSTGQMKHALAHDCAESLDAWIDRHQRYAAWQADIETRNIDLSYGEKPWRRMLKQQFHRHPFRPMLAFVDSYILCMGFRDGRAGLHYAMARAMYYWMVSAKKCEAANKALDNPASA